MLSLKIGSPTVILFISTLFGMLIGINESTLNPLTTESFPTNIKATNLAFC